MKVESRLGKGLSTFFENKQVEVPVFKNTVDENAEQGDIKYISIGNIIPNKDQPRKKFKEEQLKELEFLLERYGLEYEDVMFYTDIDAEAELDD